MLGSCVPAVVSEIRPTPGGCICPVWLLVAADARLWRPQHPAASPALCGTTGGHFAAWGIFSHTREDAGHLWRSLEIFLTRGDGCPYGAARTRLGVMPAACLRPCPCGRSWAGANMRHQLSVSGFPVLARTHAAGAPPCGASVLRSRTRCALCARHPPRKKVPRVCMKPSGRYPRLIPWLPQGGGICPRPPVPKLGTAVSSKAKKDTRRKHPPV